MVFYINLVVEEGYDWTFVRARDNGFTLSFYDTVNVYP